MYFDAAPVTKNVKYDAKLGVVGKIKDAGHQMKRAVEYSMPHQTEKSSILAIILLYRRTGHRRMAKLGYGPREVSRQSILKLDLPNRNTSKY